MVDTGLSGSEDKEDMVPVELPSGAKLLVHEQEEEYFNKRAEKYLSQNEFQNIADFQDVDRLLVLELLCHRWSGWIFTQRDYWGEGVDENSLQKSLKEHSGEIRLLKKALGLDRETREKVRGEHSAENYVARLRQRAKAFGIMRNNQAAKAIELFQQLNALITLHDNCDEKEKVEQGCQIDDIVRWIREKAIPEFESIDEEFRKEQKTWIHDQ